MLFRCERCLYPSTKPDLHFTKGICSACHAFSKRRLINWSKRELEFLELIDQNKGSTHDVIVACSGGKDSTWQIVKCLELGLRPLAVTATTDHLSVYGRRNLDNISELCDHIEITPHKPTRRKISKFALQEVGDISWCEHHLIWSVPARESVQRKIPVVLYGENPQSEYGAGPRGTETRTRLTKDWVDEYGGLLGLRLSDLSEILDIEPRHLDLYRYPQGDVRGVFMGAYFPWDGLENSKVAEKNGFRPYRKPVEGNFIAYENVDNCQTGIHDYLRWLKFGYGRTCDVASSYIRRGLLTRQQGADLAQSLDGQYPRICLGTSLYEILENIGLNRAEFDLICERFTNKPVVEWASKRESFLSCSTANTDASRENNLARIAE